ncbi:MAG: UDP-N-acetylmuramoyl-tripeptide--D-alanyl-D-alanine ligase [Acidimicrobiia bacterium]
MNWALDAVAQVTGAVLHGGRVRVTSVVTDSRQVVPGALFVALRGERHDGHDFTDAALDAGAAAVMIEKGSGITSMPRVEVRDSLEALRALAIQRRGELAAPVAGITGSTGKTSTKDLLAAALGPGAFKSPYSYNNEVGVPLTVLGTPDAATALVAEVGSRGVGDITWLAPAVRPDVVVITSIGPSHLATFGDEQTVLIAKWELIEALGPDGIAILPAWDDRLTKRRNRGVITFGEETGDVAAKDITLDDRARPSFRLRSPQGEARVALRMAGRHQALNAAAAAAAALAMGVEMEDAVTRLAGADGSPWRMEVHPGPVTVVNDAYNANPASMASALLTVAAMPGRHLAVLGMMRELGAATIEEHRAVGALAHRLGFTAVLVVGEDPGMAAAAGQVGKRVDTQKEAIDVVRGLMRPGDVVLVKASRAEGLERLAAEIIAEVSP